MLLGAIYPIVYTDVLVDKVRPSRLRFNRKLSADIYKKPRINTRNLNKVFYLATLVGPTEISPAWSVHHAIYPGR